MTLNWSSLIGIVLIPFGVVSGGFGIAQVYWNIRRISDTSLIIIIKVLFNLLQVLGRLLLMPFCGIVLFYQGWRLDPVLQFAVVLIVIAVCYEISLSVLFDYKKWKSRTIASVASVRLTGQ